MTDLSQRKFLDMLSRLFEQTSVKFNSYMKIKEKKHPHAAGVEEVGKIFGIFEIMGKKKTLEIIYFLIMHNKIRFNELQKAISSAKMEKYRRFGINKISSRTLSLRLKELESVGIVERKRYAETPPRVEYSLTEKGKELKLPMAILYWWSLKQ